MSLEIIGSKNNWFITIIFQSIFYSYFLLSLLKLFPGCLFPKATFFLCSFCSILHSIYVFSETRDFKAANNTSCNMEIKSMLYSSKKFKNNL